MHREHLASAMSPLTKIKFYFSIFEAAVPWGFPRLRRVLIPPTHPEPTFWVESGFLTLILVTENAKVISLGTFGEAGCPSAQ